MFLWFAGLSFVLVWLVFRSPAVDYRAVMLGSVLPLADGITGGAWVLHTLTASVVALVAVVLATSGRRLVQRRWIGVPVGMLTHLVLDGVWTRADLFWWPFTGWRIDERLPELARGAWVLILEAVGAAALWWCWRRFGLDDRARRQRFLQTGHLDRAVAGG